MGLDLAHPRFGRSEDPSVTGDGADDAGPLHLGVAIAVAMACKSYAVIAIEGTIIAIEPTWAR
jgi:hypothetical protein